MRIKKMDYAEEPEKLTEESFDCIWIWFRDRRQPTPIKSKAIQWVDWKLNSQISEYILSEQYRKRNQTTFVPTLSRVGSKYLAIEPNGAFHWDKFFKNCEGNQFNDILFFCEDEKLAKDLEQELQDKKSRNVNIVIGYESSED